MRCTYKAHNDSIVSYPFANVSSSIFVAVSRFLFVWALPQFGGDAPDRCLRIKMRKPLSNLREFHNFRSVTDCSINQSARHLNDVGFAGCRNLVRFNVVLKRTRRAVRPHLHRTLDLCFNEYNDH